MRDAARHRENHGHRMLGSRHGVATGCIHDDDAAARGGRGIDIVQAGTGSTDDLQLAGGRDDFRGDFRPGADDQSVRVLDFLQQLFFRQFGFHHHRKAGLLQYLDTLLRETIADQNFHCRDALPDGESKTCP